MTFAFNILKTRSTRMCDIHVTQLGFQAGGMAFSYKHFTPIGVYLTGSKIGDDLNI